MRSGHSTNNYFEGTAAVRYYGGNQNIDETERLCCERALTAFNLDPWGVNVQVYSCKSVNLVVYSALLLPKDRIMWLDSPSGGHVCHGYLTPSGNRILGPSSFFESLSYKLNFKAGSFITTRLMRGLWISIQSTNFWNQLFSYPREWDYARFSEIADKCGAILMCCMAHIGGLGVAKDRFSPLKISSLSSIFRVAS